MIRILNKQQQRIRNMATSALFILLTLLSSVVIGVEDTQRRPTLAHKKGNSGIGIQQLGRYSAKEVTVLSLIR